MVWHNLFIVFIINHYYTSLLRVVQEKIRNTQFTSNCESGLGRYDVIQERGYKIKFKKLK